MDSAIGKRVAQARRGLHPTRPWGTFLGEANAGICCRITGHLTASRPRPASPPRTADARGTARDSPARPGAGPGWAAVSFGSCRTRGARPRPVPAPGHLDPSALAVAGLWGAGGDVGVGLGVGVGLAVGEVSFTGGPPRRRREAGLSVSADPAHSCTITARRRARTQRIRVRFLNLRRPAVGSPPSLFNPVLRCSVMTASLVRESLVPLRGAAITIDAVPPRLRQPGDQGGGIFRRADRLPARRRGRGPHRSRGSAAQLGRPSGSWWWPTVRERAGSGCYQGSAAQMVLPPSGIGLMWM